ncbi:MAG: hypothetical protein GY731_15515 [Gammaproteobacteria bacterium]|nr:hypothetical protein [Gammaproteobacteria bacterium]
MLWPERGFRMYPDSNYSSDYYGPLAVRYLWYLDRLDQVPNISGNLRKAALEGVAMADSAAKAYRMERIPQRLTSMEEAYAAAVNGGDAAEIKAIIESRVDLTQDQARVRNKTHMVADRALLAYTAATLLTLGEWKTGIEIANQVTRQFNEQGRMYSTVDSVAAIVLIIQLMTSRIITGAGRVRVNGREMSSTEAAALSDQVETIEVLEGVVPIEVTCIREEDWNRSASVFPVKIGFRDEQDRLKREFRMGERAELLVTLPDGYQLGDLLHVNLPASLSWIRGGGKVKRFTLDFEGRDELRVPLVVTSAINNQQHFAVCVRNMFEEERTASPGLLTVS